MKISLYRFPNQLIAPEEPLATIVWEDGNTCIETNNKDLERELREFYSRPRTVRRALPQKEGILAFKEEIIQPNTEEFFKESIYSIRELNCYGTIEGERKVQLIALDFDGTLWQSVHECYVITVEAFQKLRWPLPAVSDLENRFTRGRFFVRVGEEFVLLMHWISEHPDRDPATMSESEEEALRKRSDGRALFEQMFYQLRKEWQEKHFEKWCALQHPYPGILEQVKILEKHFDKVVIATTKYADSVKRLLSTQGISLEVIGKENTVDKMKQMSLIASTYKKPFHQIVFVDDLLDQVRSVKSLGAKVALASWGYSSSQQKDEARKIGIPILELDHMAEMLIKLF